MLGIDDYNRLEPTEVVDDAVLEINGGRVTTFDVIGGRNAVQVELLGQPDHGHASVNPDGTIAMVLSGDHTYAGALSLDYRVTLDDGSQETATLNMNVAPVVQAKGWGLGEHYMLAEDDNGDIVVEHGDNHQKVYVSESEAALTRADIAALENMALDDVTPGWIRDQSEYGQDEGTALSTDLGIELWQQALVAPVFGPSSHWLLFEKGYEYNDLGRFMESGSEGESALHPIHITSWGDEGEAILNSPILLTQDGFKNVVVSDLRSTGGLASYDSENIMLSDVEVSGVDGTGVNIRDSDGFTMHDSSVSDSVEYTNDGTEWTGWNQGLIVTGTDHALVTGSLFHHNGWEDGYSPTNSIDYPVAPNGFKSNVYFQWSTSDVSFTDNISTMASGTGVKLRGGAFAQDNFLADNNIGVEMLGGDYKGFGNIGEFTFFGDNVLTSAGYKLAKSSGWALWNAGEMTTYLDNVLLHLANPDDPDDPDDLAAKPVTLWPFNGADGTLLYNNTTVFNWIGSDPAKWKGLDTPINIGDADPEVLMQTTIQRYASLLTNGQETTIDGLADYLLSLAGTEFDDTITARDINEYFQNALGRTVAGPDADSHRFIPNELASGMRWDNRINWSEGELPGVSDAVDLGGNHVYYGSLTTDLNALSFGDDGHLSVSSGKLSVSSAVEAGEGSGVDISGAGQFWTAGFNGSGLFKINAESGRFANIGDFDGPAAIEISGDAQAILATDGGSMVLDAQSELRIEGSDASVGFDGDAAGHATLRMEEQSTLSFVADANGFSAIEEFRSGHWDQDGSPVESGILLDGTLQIDLTNYAGGVGTLKLAEADLLDGAFDEIQIFGLGSAFDSEAVVDYDNDVLELRITDGSGQLSSSSVGTTGVAPQDDSRALWDAFDFSTAGFAGFQPGVQDKGYYALSPDGLTLEQDSQSWEQILGNVTIAADTRLRFDFSADAEGEIHGIMFTNGETLSADTTVQVFGSQLWGDQTYNNYVAGTGAKSYDIPVGALFTGDFDRFVFLTDDDANFGGDSSWANFEIVTATPPEPETDLLDFSTAGVAGFQPGVQDKGYYALSPDGLTLEQDSQSWEQFLGNVTISADTRLRFDFSADVEGEIHGIMFTNGETLSEDTTVQVFGSQLWGDQTYNNYVAGTGAKSYDIPVGALFTGDFDRFVFLTDDDANFGGDSSWANFEIVTATPPEPETDLLDFSTAGVAGFQPGVQDKGYYALSPDGLTLEQDSQSWEQFLGNVTISADTRLRFDFSADIEGEIHGIMFTNGETLSEDTTVQVFGSQLWGDQTYNNYVAGTGAKSYDIPVGALFTGDFDRFVFLTDDDANFGGDSSWANFEIL